MNIRANPQTDSARIALQIYEAGLLAVSPESIVRRSCRMENDWLRIGSQIFNLDNYKRVLLCGAGKASCGIAAELLKVVDGKISGGLMVTKDGHGLDLGPVRVVEASHPVLDERSIQAGDEVARLAESTGPQDLVLFLLSGGASALLELPKPGVTLDRIRTTNQEMLASGADIREMNRTRKEFSRLKGGGLGEMFANAHTVCLVLSDVIGDDFSVIGSGPLFTQANCIPHVLLGNLATATDAAVAKARELGLELPAGELAAFTDQARATAETWTTRFLEESAESDSVAWIAGGETVVKILGSGIGGRCQEFAAAAAGRLEGTEGVTLLAGSTDGSDGPTPYAGGFVDGESVGTALSHGVDLGTALGRNDSAAFLAASGGLIETGPTQSNVNDLYVIVKSRGKH